MRLEAPRLSVERASPASERALALALTHHAHGGAVSAERMTEAARSGEQARARLSEQGQKREVKAMMSHLTPAMRTVIRDASFPTFPETPVADDVSVHASHGSAVGPDRVQIHVHAHHTRR